MPMDGSCVDHDRRDFWFSAAVATTPEERALLPTINLQAIPGPGGFKVVAEYANIEFTNLVFELNVGRPVDPRNKQASILRATALLATTTFFDGATRLLCNACYP